MEFANIAHEQFNLLAKYQVTDVSRWSATWRGISKAALCGQTMAMNCRIGVGRDGGLRTEKCQPVLSASITWLTSCITTPLSSARPCHVAPGRSVSLSLKMKF
jgi:hypothetical protein